MHKCLGVLLLVMAVVHMLAAWKLIRQRPFAMYVTGLVMILLAITELLSYLLRKKLQAKWIWIHRIAAAGIAFCLVIHMMFGFVSLSQYKEMIREIQQGELAEVSVECIKDGVYIGECDAGYVYAKVSVTIEDGKIKAVELLKHRTERG